MLPPPVKSKVGKAAFWKLAATVAKEVVRVEIREFIEELSHQKAGFVLKAWTVRNKEIEGDGRDWTDADMRHFREVLVPEALQAAELHAEARNRL